MFEALLPNRGSTCIPTLGTNVLLRPSVVIAQDGLLPSDEAVLQAYDDCLREQQGHYTCLDTLMQVQ